MESRLSNTTDSSEYRNWKSNRSRRKLSMPVEKNVGNGEDTVKDDNDQIRLLDCTVCGSKVAREPVVTSCGHLFCWSCMYQWHKNSHTCPECRTELTADKIIPLYGRGACKKPDDSIPERPGPSVMRRTKSVGRHLLGHNHHRHHHHQHQGTPSLPVFLNCYAVRWHPHRFVYRIGWDPD